MAVGRLGDDRVQRDPIGQLPPSAWLIARTGGWRGRGRGRPDSCQLTTADRSRHHLMADTNLTPRHATTAAAAGHCGAAGCEEPIIGAGYNRAAARHNRLLQRSSFQRLAAASGQNAIISSSAPAAAKWPERIVVRRRGKAA